MAGKIPPQFLKKGATSQGGPSAEDDTKKNAKLPAFLKKGAAAKGSKDQNASDGENPFAHVTRGKAKAKKKLTAAEKKKLADKARKDAAAKAFGGKD